MIGPAPELSEGDLQLELHKLFDRARRSFLVALYARGEAGRVSAMGRDWEVIPTQSEMTLRERMPRLDQAREDGKVFLIDWSERPLPLDLSSRLAGGRVYHVSRSTRLAALFGARHADPELEGSGLASVLLSGDVPSVKKVSGLRLTRRDAVRHFLHAWAGFPLADEMNAHRLARWCIASNAGPALAQKADQSKAWRKTRAELQGYVEEQAGALGGLCWQAWEQGMARRFVEVAVLLDAHARVRAPVAEGLLQGRLPQLAPGFGSELMEPGLVDALRGMLDALFSSLEENLASSILRQADALIPEPGFTSTRAASPWLPSGHAARERRFGEALRALAEASSEDRFARVRETLGEVEEHLNDARARTEAEREARLMSARLAAYLVTRAQALAPLAGVSYEAVTRLATAYAAQGGFVDWCRGRLRTPMPFAETVNDAIYAVLKAADALRRQDDALFARALPAWYEAGRPSQEVTPIEHGLRRFVTELLGGHKGRKILIIMMDGMSWASAVQLLHGLEQERWAPIVWRPKGFEARTHLPAVLAALPTLTLVSRAAFFAGRADGKAGAKGAKTDAARWAANPSLIKANDDEALPDLIQRAMLMDGEALRADVRKTIDGDAQVVGVIVNAIDEELKGSSQVMRDYSKTVIKPLMGLMSAAAGAERVVLLASDHGHALGDAMKPHGRLPPGATTEGRRWRTLANGEPPLDFEVALPASTWRPKGSARVAAIWDEAISHGHPAHGEHGGLSMAEVVAPAILLAPEWLSQLKGEEGPHLETRPFPHPAWWDLEIPPSTKAPGDTTSVSRQDERTQEQIPLLVGATAPQARSSNLPRPVREHELVSRLRKSKAFKANVEGRPEADVDKHLGYLSVLVEAGGALPDQEFARQCQTRAHRVAGLVARMGTLLNIDGYSVVEHDRAGHQVRLHRERLVAQYGLDP
jgi:hypothetical protein